MISANLIVLLGSYAGWAAGAFSVLFADLQKQDRHPDRWGTVEWGLLCLVAGGVALPFYFWATRGTGQAVVRGIFLGIVVALLAFLLRVGFSLVLDVALL